MSYTFSCCMGKKYRLVISILSADITNDRMERAVAGRQFKLCCHSGNTEVLIMPLLEI